MLERDLLLDATTAILLAVLVWRIPAVGRREGAGSLAMVVIGTLLPLVDPILAYLLTTDRIAWLSRAPLVQGPAVALLVIGVPAVLALALGQRALALRIGGGVGLGFALHASLGLLSPVGWPLLAPFVDARYSLPLLPAGHLPLMLVLFLALAALLALPRQQPWIVAGTCVLVGVYLLAGAVQYTVLRVRTADLAGPGGVVFVHPDGPWLLRWQVVVEAPERYELRRQGAFAAPAGEAKTMARWNDQPLFLKLMGDPVVNRFYFQVFRHPVVRLDVTGTQITLLMQELEDQSPLVPGPTFYLESDLTGRNRFYQLQRFN